MKGRLEVQLKNRDQEIFGHQQVVQWYVKETNSLRASLQECRSSQRMQRSEESWQQELRHLKELLEEKDQQICREKRTLAEAHTDTLALLSSTQAVLKQEEKKCASLEEECCKKLTDQEQKHQTELKKKEEGFQKEVCENITKTKQMVSDLPLWEAK